MSKFADVKMSENVKYKFTNLHIVCSGNLAYHLNISRVQKIYV